MGGGEVGREGGEGRVEEGGDCVWSGGESLENGGARMKTKRGGGVEARIPLVVLSYRMGGNL